MTALLQRVVDLLRSRSIPHALAGAAAMAFHGVSRSTADLDLLVCDPSVLADDVWRAFRESGIAVEVRRGDDSDPLRGLVRIVSPGETPIDVVVGRHAWQAEAIGRAPTQVLEGTVLPVLLPADLVLLKLYAGGPQDAWDVEQLLGAGDRAAMAAAVESRLAALPRHAAELWGRIAGGR